MILHAGRIFTAGSPAGTIVSVGSLGRASIIIGRPGTCKDPKNITDEAILCTFLSVWLQQYIYIYIYIYHRSKDLFNKYIIIIIIIIMSRRQHRYPWPSLATFPYHSSPPAGLQGYILCPHIVAVCKFVLVVLLLHIHMWGSTGVHHLWARPCFLSKCQFDNSALCWHLAQHMLYFIDYKVNKFFIEGFNIMIRYVGTIEHERKRNHCQSFDINIALTTDCFHINLYINYFIYIHRYKSMKTWILAMNF